MIWRCPLCLGDFRQDHKTFGCANGHRFDMARQGYVNLLPVQNKKSRAPGDSKLMLDARRAFLEAGHYEPLAKALAKYLTPFGGGPCRGLDLGGGEGYYLSFLQASNWHWHLTDISKEAVRMASRRLPAGQSAVASSFQLPIVSGSLDLVIRNFAPSDDAELARILGNKGELIIVAPGPDHLKELRTALYQTPEAHEPPATPVGFKAIEQRALTYTINDLSDSDRINLLSMTPMNWRADERGREQWLNGANKSITADFLLLRMTK